MRPWILLLLALAGCSHTFPLPYQASQLRADALRWPGEALVHYLSQPNADLSACASPVRSQHDDDLVDPFIGALESGALPAERWQACATRLLPVLPEAARMRALARLAPIIEQSAKEQSTPKLAAALGVALSRPRERTPALEALLPALRGLDGPLIPDFVRVLELDQGLLDGAALTLARIESTDDEASLLLMNARLTDDALRTAARRKLVASRIERSDVREVKTRAAEVAAEVVRTGRWAVRPDELAPRAGAPLAVPFTALARQDVDGQSVTLWVPGAQGLTLLPPLDLAQQLSVDVGWSHPLRVCAPAAALEVAPCIAPALLTLDSPDARVDDDGLVRFADQLPMARALELAGAANELVLPVRLGGRLVTSLSVPVRFLTPSPVELTGERAEAGPDLDVVVTSRPEALLFDVAVRGARLGFVVPRGTQAFTLSTVGGAGVTGSDGRNGLAGVSGLDGSSASCPSMAAQSGSSGSNGSDGSDGAPGGPGGQGGQVSVTIRCADTCAADEQLVRAVVRSVGGAGGAGGDGGQGGDGGSAGRGGSGATCTTEASTDLLPSGADGARGSDGLRGASGDWGTNGPAGAVRVQLAREPE